MKNKPIKILNLYAGLGGNRKLWKNVEVTSIEIDENIANIYSQLYPNDSIIVTDAHKYLELEFKNFDFIWSSPPCPSHSLYRHNIGVMTNKYNPIMIDMTLYSEVIFLQTYFEGKFVVENVNPYYDFLIPPTFKLQRHIFWANFRVPKRKFESDMIGTKNSILDFSTNRKEEYNILKNSKVKNKLKLLRNMTMPEIGEYILQMAYKERNLGTNKIVKTMSLL